MKNYVLTLWSSLNSLWNALKPNRLVHFEWRWTWWIWTETLAWASRENDVCKKKRSDVKYSRHFERLDVFNAKYKVFG